MISDIAIVSAKQPAITYAMRGALAFELELTGLKQDLHSGVYGGAIPNPLHALSGMLAALHDKHGRVSIPGFYDAVKQWDQAERAYMKKVGSTDQQILQRSGAIRAAGEPGFTLYESTTIRPSLSINGIIGGYQGKGTKAVIPTKATAKISMRLVPNQDPKEIEAMFRQFIAHIKPPNMKLKITKHMAAEPVFIDRNHSVVQAAVKAYQYGFGKKPVFFA